MTCPIGKHTHELKVIKHHTQDDTGTKAVTVECPNGTYRWFLVEGRPPSNTNKMVRPRWGWKS